MITTPFLPSPSEKRKKRNLTITPEHSNFRTIQYKITPEEMWQCVKGSSQNWGIEGYEIAKKYYDYHQVKWYQERKKILDQHKRAPICWETQPGWTMRLPAAGYTMRFYLPGHWLLPWLAPEIAVSLCLHLIRRLRLRVLLPMKRRCSLMLIMWKSLPRIWNSITLLPALSFLGLGNGAYEVLWRIKEFSHCCFWQCTCCSYSI